MYIYIRRLYMILPSIDPFPVHGSWNSFSNSIMFGLPTKVQHALRDDAAFSLGSCVPYGEERLHPSFCCFSRPVVGVFGVFPIVVGWLVGVRACVHSYSVAAFVPELRSPYCCSHIRLLAWRDR